MPSNGTVAKVVNRDLDLLLQGHKCQLLCSGMLCYMLRYVVLSCNVLSSPALRVLHYAVLCRVMIIVLHNVTLCYAIERHLKRYAMIWQFIVMLHQVLTMLCYGYAILCYAVYCCVIMYSDPKLVPISSMI